MRANLLADMAQLYVDARRDFDNAGRRGDTKRADDALSVMQDIERCVQVTETSTAWRQHMRTRHQQQDGALLK